MGKEAYQILTSTITLKLRKIKDRNVIHAKVLILMEVGGIVADAEQSEANPRPNTMPGRPLRV